jgi:lysyl-tRNA synthetase class 2
VITIPASPPRPGRPGGIAARYAQFRDPAARQILETRSAVTSTLRHLLHEQGFTEVDTPLLQRARPAPGRSFRTETAHQGPHVYLRSSPLHLRAVLTAGLPRVFEIGRSFRDEPADPTHSPEYSLVEAYQAGGDYMSMRALARTLITAATEAAAALPGRGTVLPGTLVGEWPCVPFYQALSHATGEEVVPGTSTARMRELASAVHVAVRAQAGADEIALELYDRLVEPATDAPVFYTDFPAGPSPLARPSDEDGRVAQKWDLVIGGREIATAYTEQHDPEQLRQALAGAGDHGLSSEATELDPEWMEVFSAGMPPAGGLCIGLERLLLTVTGAASLSDVIPFPFAGTP